MKRAAKRPAGGAKPWTPPTKTEAERLRPKATDNPQQIPLIPEAVPPKVPRRRRSA